VGTPVSGIGEIFEHTFDVPGVYRYHCEPHLGDGMRGVIVVQ
jgi:plastocyanin